MSGKLHQCWTLVCDGCGKDIHVDIDGGDRHFSSPPDAREHINELWDDDFDSPVSVDGLDLCGDCRMKPHAYVPIDRPYREDGRCMRCLVDRDDHEGEPA